MIDPSPVDEARPATRSRGRRGRLRHTLAILLLSLGAGPAGGAMEDLEVRLRAAVLFNFVKFVEWPERREGPFILGVMGAPELAKSLQATVKGKAVRGRRFRVVRVDEKAPEIDCHLLYVATSHTERLPELVERFLDPAVLTVGEEVPFVGEGGIVGFTLRDSRLRFFVRPDAARQAGLVIRSQLLDLAIVWPEGEGKP